MKRLLSVILIVTLLLTAALPALGATDGEYAAARRLYELGLLRGRGVDSDGEPDFALDSPATREEAVVMILRLEGRPQAEQADGSMCPFTDVSDWARNYLYYAFTSGIVKGRSDTFFDAKSDVTAAEYLTMVLRALWYHTEASDVFEKDFDWDKPWTKSDEIGLTNGEYNDSTTNFTRGDMVRISERALGCTLNGLTYTLLQRIDGENGLRDAQNITSFAATDYFDGETARPSPALRIVCEEFAGQRQTYVHMDDLPLLLAAAAEVLEVSDDGVSAQYTQKPGSSDGEAFFSRDYGAFCVEQDVKGAGMQIFTRILTISLPPSEGEQADSGEACTLTVNEHPRPERLWCLHFNNGVRFFYADTKVAPSMGYGYIQFVNAGDFLAYFGFDCMLALNETANGYVWSLER